MDRQTSKKKSPPGPFERLTGGLRFVARDGRTPVAEEDLAPAIYVVAKEGEDQARILSGPYEDEGRATKRALLDEGWCGIKGVALLDLRERDADGNPVDWVDPEAEARRRALERNQGAPWAEGDYWLMVETGELA